MKLIIEISIFIFLLFTLFYLYKYRKDKYVFIRYFTILLSLGFFAIALFAAIADDILFVTIGVIWFGYFLGYFYDE